MTLGLTITKLLTGLILLAMCFTGLTIYLGEIQNNYGFEINETYTDVYGKINSSVYDSGSTISNMSGTFQDQINGTPASGILGFADDLFNAVIGTLKTTWRSSDIATDMVSAGTSTIPGVSANPWIATGIISIITLTILLLILGIMARRDRL